MPVTTHPSLITPHQPITHSRLRRTVRSRLLRWFARHQRRLPWRRDRDPYRIWVSEVMLQQTTVAAVVPYFGRFLAAFPDLPSLAAAREEDVLRLWEGLGYYRRARDLHRAARQVVAEHGGCIPRDLESFRRLPGAGRYTAGAVLSQAFDQKLPILEANSRRVLARVLGLAEDVHKSPGLRRLWQAAEEFLPDRRAGDFNQALMELGALICTPAAPACDRCPLAVDCRARRFGLQDSIPRRPAPPAVVEVREVAVVIVKDGRALLAQRPGHGRWGGMWEFPHGELPADATPRRAAGRLAEALTGIRVENLRELPAVRHSVTRHRITMHCFLGRYRSGRFRSAFYVRGRWVEPARLHEYPVSVPQRRLARELFNETQARPANR